MIRVRRSAWGVLCLSLAKCHFGTRQLTEEAQRKPLSNLDYFITVRQERTGASTAPLGTLGTPHPDRAICPAAHQPRQPIEPLHPEHAQPIRDRVPAQDLQRHDQRVRQQVVVYAAVEDLDRPVVGCRGEEWVRRMEVQRSNRPGMVSIKRIIIIVINLFKGEKETEGGGWMEEGGDARGGGCGCGSGKW